MFLCLLCACSSFLFERPKSQLCMYHNRWWNPFRAIRQTPLCLTSVPLVLSSEWEQKKERDLCSVCELKFEANIAPPHSFGDRQFNLPFSWSHAYEILQSHLLQDLTGFCKCHQHRGTAARYRVHWNQERLGAEYATWRSSRPTSGACP